MIIKDIFIVESTSPASFGRLNLQGVILGRKIFIPKFPYHLTTHFVVLGKVPADMEICDLTLSISPNWAEVPALPGCITEGETMEEVMINLKDAIEGWLDVANSRHAIESTDR
ncbi:hypothetical protein NSTC745_00018 [Nostoc sp. DSM 114161]|jgi:hypothetical protein|uniref:type II toxin-antitoxin system HicB family antitoxin n=1 Tax=Nostoc sp. DSM 114161 TaxID=3440143 RepID=UPI00404653F5